MDDLEIGKAELELMAAFERFLNADYQGSASCLLAAKETIARVKDHEKKTALTERREATKRYLLARLSRACEQ